MSSKEQIMINIKIKDWWIDWWRDDKHYLCAIVEVNNKQYQYIERELDQT